MNSIFPIEPVKHQKSEPSIRLLNEIDILLTQVRLAELYLKQAQTAAADEVARVHERYESELENLRTAINQKERSPEESSARVAATENLHRQIQDLEARLEAHRRLLENRDQDLQRATAEVLTSRSQIAELQSAKDEALTAARDAEHVRHELQTELGKLRDEIGQKTLELQQHRSGSRGSEQILQDRLRRLQDKLAQEQGRVSAKDSDLERARAEFQACLQESQSLAEELERQLEQRRAAFAQVERDLQERLNESDEQLRRKQASIDERESELQRACANLAALQSRIAGLETDLAEAEAFKHETQRVQAALENEIAALRERAEQLELLQKQTERLLSVQAEQIRQRVRAELEELDARLASKDRELHAVRESAAEAQANLNATIGEIADLKARASGLSEQAAQMASAARDAESTSNGEVERVRLEYQAELLNLQEELRGNHHALADQEARAMELERRLGARVTDLESELAAKQQLLQEREEALNTANSSAVALQERLSRLEAASRDEQITAAKELDLMRRALEAEMAELRNELLQKDSALAQRQASSDDFAQEHNSQIQTLEAELAELRRVAENRATELDRAVSEGQRLLRRVDQLEAAAANAEATAMSRVEQMTQQHETQMAALHIEIERKKAALEEHGVAQNNVE